MQDPGNRPDLAIAEAGDPVAVLDRADGGDHGGRAGAEALVGAQSVVDVDLLLADLVTPVPRDLDDRLPGDSRQYGPGQLRRRDDAVLDAEEVGRSDLLDVPVVNGVEVDDLGEALGLGGLRWDHPGRVVADRLHPARAARGGAVEIIRDLQRDRPEAALEVGPHRGDVDQERVLGCGCHTEDCAAAHQQRPDVERALAHGGDPAAVLEHGLADRVEEHLLRDDRHPEALRAVLHATRVPLGPEHDDAAVGCALRLQALEQALAVVENPSGR